RAGDLPQLFVVPKPCLFGRAFLRAPIPNIQKFRKGANVPTLKHALAAIERHLGFPISRGRTVAARLQEAGYIEHGAPGVAPQISPDGFVALLIALAANKTLA